MKTKRKAKVKNTKPKKSNNKTKKRYHKKSLYDIYKQMILNYKKD
uniref:Uncharacterized protein n=1 Tax=viral metagenome TaxID=1070528 RepID=A0A6C0CFC5_9ZZZZ